MHCSGTFTGQFIVDGKVDAEAVKVYMSDGEATFTSETGGVMLRRKKLHLHPFNRFVMFTQDARELANESVLELSGTRVGALVEGPLGHPGDNENALLRVASVRVATTHSRDGLLTSMQGTTIVASRHDRPTSFKVWFRIPLASYQSFFCLNPETQHHVAQVYAELFGAA